MFALHRAIKMVEKTGKRKNFIIEYDLKSLYLYNMFKINAGKTKALTND